MQPPQTPGDPLPAFLLVSEVAQILRLSHMTVYRLIYAGELKTLKVGGSFRIPRSEFRRYLKESELKGKADEREPAPGDGEN